MDEPRLAGLDAAGAIHDVGEVGEIFYRDEESERIRQADIEGGVPHGGRGHAAALAVGGGRERVGEVGDLRAEVVGLDLAVKTPGRKA